MNNQSTTVMVAMSGGVDSSTAAALLLQQGYQVMGINMDFGLFREINDVSDTVKPSEDAQKVAEKLGIELFCVDFQQNLQEVISYFLDEYRHGYTPNPCIMCNRKLKFGKLLQLAQSHGADFLATGHYARIQHDQDEVRLLRGIDRSKDQSYALFGIGRENLGKIMLPLGGYDKQDTRKMAAELDLPVHDKEESQEICFIPDDDYVGFLLEKDSGLARPGKIIDSDGNILGEHEGIFRYTIGQRRGLGIALGEPAYVTHIDVENNTVTLGKGEELEKDRLRAGNVIWLIDPVPSEPFEGNIQIRYNHRGAAGKIVPIDDKRVEVIFDEPVRAVTPGQAAVFYQGDRVIGGGWIEKDL